MFCGKNIVLPKVLSSQLSFNFTVRFIFLGGVFMLRRCEAVCVCQLDGICLRSDTGLPCKSQVVTKEHLAVAATVAKEENEGE